MNSWKTENAILFLPVAAILICAFLIPIAYFFYTSLSELGGPADVAREFGDVASRGYVRAAFIFTAYISLIVTLATLLISYPIAYVMTRIKGFAFKLIVVCIIIPYFTSTIVRTFAWMILLGRAGAINSTLMSWGVIDSPLMLMYNQSGIVIGMVYMLLPYMCMTLYVSMKNIDPRILMASDSLGASQIFKFFNVFLPLSFPGVISGCLIVFILSLGFFVTPALMGGPSNVVAAMLIQQEVEIQFNWPTATILSIILLVITLALYGLYCKYTNIGKSLL